MNTVLRCSVMLCICRQSLAIGNVTCSLVGFVPFTASPGAKQYLNLHGSRAFSQMAAALLAIDDFNSRNAAVVSELESPMYKNCSVYIPEEDFIVYDTSNRGYVPKKLVGEQSTCDSTPCAIVGPYTDLPTMESSVIAEAWDIPVISHGAEENVFSGRKHPMVFRSCVNLHAMGEVIIQFLRSKGRTNSLGGIYTSGDFGVYSHETIVNAAKESVGGFPRRNMQKITPPFPGDSNTVLSIGYAMHQLKKSSYRTIFLALNSLELGLLSMLADAAEENGMNGGDYVYVIVIPNVIELDEIVLEASSNKNVTKLVNGAALVRVLDGFMYRPTDPFLKHWRNQNDNLAERVNKLNPIKEGKTGYSEGAKNYFQTQMPLQGSSFMYDAVMMAGMAKCKEQVTKKDKAEKMRRRMQTLKKVTTNSFVKAIETLKFTGATGTVEFQESARLPRNRQRGSVAYGVYNYRATTVSNQTLNYTLAEVITDGTVNGTITKLSNGPFIFADGTSTPPYLLHDPPEENYLPKGIHIFGLSLMGICVFLNLLGIALVSCYRRRVPIQDAQPHLLYLILIGSTTMVFSIFPRSFDESFHGWDNSTLDKMCVAFPWLSVMGFLITYAALLGKLYIIKKQKRISVKDSVLMILCILVILSMVTILSFVDPPYTWTRSIINQDTLESYGKCTNNGSDSNGIMLTHVIMLTLAAILLICMAYIAFDVRKSYEKLAEARSIFYVVFSHLQILIIGIPLVISSGQSTTAAVSYLIPSILILIVSLSTTTLIFGPKIFEMFFSDGVKLSDSVWAVNLSDLKFDDPPEVIGRGTFGLVLLAEYRGTNVAVKRVIPPRNKPKDLTRQLSQWFDNTEPMDKSESDKSELKTGITFAASGSFLSGSLKSPNGYDSLKADFILEMRALSKLRHPNITTIMGAIIAKKVEPMMIMEYMDLGSLYDVLHNETMILEGDIILPILCDIAQGLRFLHAASPAVLHGDLKAANVLLDNKFRAKVADFGLSQKNQIGVSNKSQLVVTGTPYWMAPELLSRESSNSTATDVYSFGVILYEVYSRKNPYEGEDSTETLKMIADPTICKRPPAPPSCPQQVRDMMNKCLSHDPKQRPSFADLDIRFRGLDVDKVEPNKMIFSLQEKKRTDMLLYDVFPRHIAEALRDGRKIDPEARDVVTIFFSDIVGFTNISSTLEPIKISLMLDRLYHSFDQISRQHDVFKVETIGDAYMAVTNLVSEQPDHARRIADFAIDAVRAARETPIDLDDLERGCVNIRIGFHSGPVVANVVGSRNPRYCLFGDTVNTASRMESNSIQNRIHCSERAAKLLREQNPDMPLQSRGIISVKGKGEMHTYWVNEGSKDCLASQTNRNPKLKRQSRLFSKRHLTTSKTNLV